MAIEHVWVVLLDGSRVRGDQVTGFCDRAEPTGATWTPPGAPDRPSSYYGIEVFGTSANDKFRKLVPSNVPLPDGAEGDFIAQLYVAAGRATEAEPYFIQAILGEHQWNPTTWRIAPLRLS